MVFQKSLIENCVNIETANLFIISYPKLNRVLKLMGNVEQGNLCEHCS